MEAELKDGECVVDLGCGSGIACFMAARLVGKAGWAMGIDLFTTIMSIQLKKDRVEYRFIPSYTGHE